MTARCALGPQSAGAAPGPACYGLGGTEPTVTDANLVLGRLGADRFLGGEMKLDVAAAERALQDQDRRAARHERGRSRRRHPAHRRDHDVLRGERRHHRARPRCRRFRAVRLWRRRPAARRRSRARDRHAQGHRAVRARRVLGVRHAVLRPALRLRAHLVHARSKTRLSTRSKRSIARWSSRAATRSPPPRSSRRRSRSSAPPTCAMSARSMR